MITTNTTPTGEPDRRIIAVDFDGCLCDSYWPELGEPIPEVLAEIKHRQRAGCRIILWTCRCGEQLAAAVDWCAAHGLHFDAVNDNLPEVKAAYGCRVTQDHGRRILGRPGCPARMLPG